MSYLIKYDNGSYNWGSGHEVEKKEATRYSTQEQAYAIARGITGEDMIGVSEIEYVSDAPASLPRQDSVTDQLKDLVKLANQNGMYDAADWIMHRLEK